MVFVREDLKVHISRHGELFLVVAKLGSDGASVAFHLNVARCVIRRGEGILNL